MLEQVKEHVKVLFRDAKIKGFLGLRDDGGSIQPYVFSSAEEVDNGFSLGKRETGPPARYPMAKLALQIVCDHPKTTLGVLVRGCDERALNELKRWNQIPDLEKRIVKVGFACLQELANAHECRQPYPDEIVAGEKCTPVTNESVKEIDGLDLGEKLQYWKAIFDRCIKCYGCRNVCPVCFCNVCTLEDDMLITTGDLPPENPMFHLTRAVHMAGRCIDCNLCTEVCPAEIPLRTLYKKVAEIVKDEFGYVTGLAEDGKSPLHILGPEPGHTTADE
jgi:formate dehydrogenase (coenzyme F420) beta subunit